MPLSNCAVLAIPSMTAAKYKCLQWQDDRVKTKDERVDQSDCVDRMQIQPIRRTQTLVFQPLVVACIEVRKAVATRRYAVQPAFVERFEDNKDCTRRP